MAIVVISTRSSLSSLLLLRFVSVCFEGFAQCFFLSLQALCFPAGGGSVGTGSAKWTSSQTATRPTQRLCPRPSELQPPRSRMRMAACCSAKSGALWSASDTTRGWWGPVRIASVTLSHTVDRVHWNNHAVMLTCWQHLSWRHFRVWLCTGESRGDGRFSATASESVRPQRSDGD